MSSLTATLGRLGIGLFQSAVGTIRPAPFGLAPRRGRAEPGRGRRRAEIALVALLPAVLALVWSRPVTAEELVLDPGKEHVISPSQTTCFTETNADPEGTNAQVDARCSGADGTADVEVVASRVLKKGNFSATAAFFVNFKVRQAKEGEAHRSFVPLNVYLPLAYAARLRNDAAFGAVADLQISLALRSSGRDHGKVPVLTARHGGLGECLTVPTTKIEIAEALVKCALGVQQIFDVTETGISLSAVVETGRPYELELRMEGSIAKGLGLATFLAVRSGRCDWSKPNCFPPDEPESTPGLYWRDMLITIGTDPAGRRHH
jgi:hypothetical protein